MRHSSIVVVSSLATFLAACSGCGGGSAESKPAAPAASGSTEVPIAASDDEEAAEVGVEGEDDTPPPETMPSAKPSAGSGSTALIAEANRELGVMATSVYSHKTHIDESHGSFEYDCSGFVDYSLAHAAPDALAELRKASVKRPLAKHFVNFFASIPAAGHLGRWHRVARVADLVPGDLVAWLRPADSASKNSGHVMIVHGPVVKDAEHPEEIAVPVVDSTAARHGKGDSRAKHASGLGTGAIVLVVDASGAPIHYRWTRGKSREHASTIALAHLE